jgi:nitric oxide synthase-interacting protein
MGRHSKNNNALPFFTHAERQMLDYGTREQRLGRDSMRDYDACYLCLSRARDPVCCDQGHLGCRECVLENLLSQKKDMARWEKQFAKQQERLQQEQQQLEQQQKQQQLIAFEKTVVNGLSVKPQTEAKKPVLPSFWVVNSSLCPCCPVYWSTFAYKTMHSLL